MRQSSLVAGDIVSETTEICAAAAIRITVVALAAAVLAPAGAAAHIAAKKGSVRVLEELLKFDKNIVTNSRYVEMFLNVWHSL